jgi:hypothetical protein
MPIAMRKCPGGRMLAYDPETVEPESLFDENGLCIDCICGLKEEDDDCSDYYD